MTFTAVTLKLLEGFETTFLIFIITLVAAIPLGIPSMPPRNISEKYAA